MDLIIDFQNWIWKKTNELEDDNNDTIAILTEHQGLRTRLKKQQNIWKKLKALTLVER